jgi:hypothetical protein
MLENRTKVSRGTGPVWEWNHKADEKQSGEKMKLRLEKPYTNKAPPDIEIPGEAHTHEKCCRGRSRTSTGQLASTQEISGQPWSGLPTNAGTSRLYAEFFLFSPPPRQEGMSA